MSHSKRNTSLAFFTSYERELLRSSWGSQKTRLTRDSFLPFGSCTLCLLPATDPVACAGGVTEDPSESDSAAQTGTKRKRGAEASNLKCHIFCRECIISNLLAQRQAIKRLQKKAEKDREEAAEAEALGDAETQRQAIEEFERVQAGLGKSQKSRQRQDYWKEKGNTAGSSGRDSNGAAEKDPEDIEKARRELKRGPDSTSTKENLPSFWTPGILADQAPKGSSLDSNGKEAKLAPICPSSVPGQSHPIGLKTLVSVKFTEDDPRKANTKLSQGQGKNWVCPACNKGLTNASKAVLARPCGHVLCRSCVHQFILGDASLDASDSVIDPNADRTITCFVCSEDLTAKKAPKSEKLDKESKEPKQKDKIKPGLVEISSDGTGFAAGGANMVKRQGVSFQHG